MAGLQDIPIRWPDEYDAAFFDRLFREVLSKADVRNAVEGTGITITGSSDDPATIAASDDVAALLGASIVTATDESGGDLTNVRQLAAGNFSILLQDNGPEGTLDISVGVINWGDLDDIPDLSVVGAPLVTTGFSEATFITSDAGGDDTVLSRVASVLDWTKFTAAMFPDSMVTALGSAAFDITTTLLTLTGALAITNTGAPDIVRLGMSALADDDATGAAFVGMLADGYAVHVPDAAGSIGLGTEGVVALLIDASNQVNVLTNLASTGFEFVAQSANPGTVPANTLWMDDGTTYTANTVVVGDLTVPMLLTANVGFGDPGTEQGGINVNGVTYDALVKINGFGGTLDASLILHRHSTSFPPNLTFARTNDDTSAHTAVVLGQTLGSLIFTGWTATHYDIGAVIDARVSPTGTVSATSLPTEIAFFTTPDGADAALLGFLLGSDQTVYGGIAAGATLTLQGAQNTPDVGILAINSPVTFTYDTFANTTPVQQFVLTWAPTVSITGAYIGGMLSTSAVFNISTAVFIPAIFSDTNRYNIGAAPGFSAITFINELSVVANDGNFALPSALVMNIGLTHERNTAGTSTTAGTTGVSFSPQTRATVSGAIMTKTQQIGVRFAPSFSTVAGSTANLGILIGLQMNNPAVALFQPQAGVEGATAIYGLVMNAMAFGGNITKAAVLSGLAAATNAYVILNTGTAQSDFGAGSAHWDDNAGIQLGGLTNAARDVLINWNGTGLEFDFIQNADTLVVNNPVNNQILFNIGASEYTFNTTRGFALGAQTGTLGNTFGAFVFGANSTQLAGEYSQFLLTQAGNLTVDHAMGLVAGWTINAPSITLGTGSLTSAAALNVGGNPGVATVNRVGVRIISNPSGGSGINAALWVTAGRSVFDGIVDLNQPIALGGGAIATLGTIGGTGPTAAAQAQWVQIEVAGVNHWVAAWT